MALPPTYNLELYEGDEFELTVRLRDADDVIEDLTGLVAKSQIKAAIGDAVMAEFECTVLPNGVADVDKGKIRLFLDTTEATQLVPGNAVWDLQVSEADLSGRKTRLRGSVTITGEVTT